MPGYGYGRTPGIYSGEYVSIITVDHDNVVLSASVLQKAMSAHKSALKEEQKGCFRS
jgi:hypothetical protein